MLKRQTKVTCKRLPTGAYNGDGDTEEDGTFNDALPGPSIFLILVGNFSRLNSDHPWKSIFVLNAQHAWQHRKANYSNDFGLLGARSCFEFNVRKVRACELSRQEGGSNRILELCHETNCQYSTCYCRFMKFYLYAPLLRLITTLWPGIRPIQKLKVRLLDFHR